MYSVLIQNEKTIESFNEFYPLFLNVLDSKVGICRWNEAGYSVATALPEINTLTDDKRDWRAVIVRVADELGMSNVETDKVNPYDFQKCNALQNDTADENDSKKSFVHEATIPLVKLTQMLGGVPAPDTGYSEHEKYVRKRDYLDKGISERNIDYSSDSSDDLAADREIYEREIINNEFELKEFKEISDSFATDTFRTLFSNAYEYKYFFTQNVLSVEDAELYEQLCRKYEFTGKPPAEIVLITFNESYKEDIRGSVRAVWTNPLETKSSEFWKRNDYPGKCRFLTYNCTKEGPVQHNADMFNFWTTVMLIATNDIDPSSVQAYRLYSVKSIFNKRKMASTLKGKTEEMLKAKVFFEEEIRKDAEKRALQRETLPDINKQIVVEYRPPEMMNVTVDTDEYGLTSNSEDGERRKWKIGHERAEQNLTDAYRSAERSLEKATDSIRLHNKYQQKDVKYLDRFAEEDLRLKLGRYEAKILEDQSELPSIKLEERENIDALEADIRHSIKSRITKNTSWLVVAVIVGLMLFAAIPALLFFFMFDRGLLWGALAYSVALLVVFGITELIVLKRQRSKFISRVDAYNELLRNLADKLSASVRMFNEFSDRIVTYARGCSFLEYHDAMKYDLEHSYDTLHMHYRATIKMLDMLKEWDAAYFLDINFTDRFEKDMYVDTSEPAERNSFFTLESGDEYRVPINDNGEYIISPLSFVEKVEIAREELYES